MLVRRRNARRRPEAEPRGRVMEACDVGPMPGPRDKWMAEYVTRMVERGIPQDFALANFHAAEDSHDYTSDPRDAADDEIYYMAQDCNGEPTP